MSTINGFGTLRYGWKSLPDGSAVATYWLVAAFFPVVPLWRERVRIHSPYASGGIQVPFLVATGFQTNVEVIEYLRLDWFSILTTYFKAYVVVPAILFVPIAATIGSVHWYFGSAAPLPPYVILIEAVGSIIYIAIVVAYILDGAAGRRSLPKAIPLTIDVSCTHCGNRFGVRIEDAGKLARCKRCSKDFVPNIMSF